MIDGLFDIIRAVVGTFVIFVVVSLPFVVLSYWGTSVDCSTYQEVTGRKTKLVMMTCYIQDNNQWFRWDEYRLRNASTGVVK